MKNKKILAAAGVTAVLASSCGKYEDGPNFSLLSKKSRVVGTWDMKTITDSQTGATDNFCQNGAYCVEITMDKDNKLTQKISYGSYTETYTGTWEFNDDKTQLIWATPSYTTSYEIKRLTNKELWLDDDITATDGDIYKLETK